MYAVNLKFYYAGGSCRFMFQCSTKQVKEELDWVFMFVRDKSELVTYMYCYAVFRSDIVDRLYGMQRDKMWGGGRFPVSSYVASLLAKQCDEAMIAELARRLNISKNPVLDGLVFEWLFLAAVQMREVKLFADQNNFDTLPQANVLPFDPKKHFKIWPKDSTTRYPGEIFYCHGDGTYDILDDDGKKNTKVESNKIELLGEDDKSEQAIFKIGDKVDVLPNSTIIPGDRKWLQPITWNQGGYDAVYFDVAVNKVIFVQVARSSDKHSFKMFYFNEVLLKLKSVGLEDPRVEIYFLVKPSQHSRFKIGDIEDHELLARYDARWTGPEDKHLAVRAFDAYPICLVVFFWVMRVFEKCTRGVWLVDFAGMVAGK